MKTAVVTGASSGIGFAIARALCVEGWRVYGLCRRDSVPEGVRWLACDVTDRATVKQAIQEILAETGRVDVWVNNAGMGIAGALEFEKEEDIRTQFEVNLFGCIWCTQEIFPVMRAQNGGRIVYMSSLAGIFPIPFQTLYAAGKSALNTLSDAVGLEGRPFGIETCTVLLNDVKTGFTDKRKIDCEGNAEVYGGRVLTSVHKMEVSERHGMPPEQVAAVVLAMLRRKKIPPHKIVGTSNVFLSLLSRLLPAKWLMALLFSLYGGA